jgi:serine/threonine-protein kinase
VGTVEDERHARIEAWLTTLGADAASTPLDATLRSTPPGGPSTAVGPLPRIPLDVGAADDQDEYRVVATLGEGGQGRVLLAWQASLVREVAIKTLKDAASTRAARALIGEARLTGSLAHPGVIPVHALGVDAEGRPVLVLKRVDGVDWETLLTTRDHPAWAHRLGPDGDFLDAQLEILARITEPLELAHHRGIIHRDIKPANVMLGEYGEVYLVDWGIATSADPNELPDEPSTLVGTPAFMAPEMATGAPVDARTDVYLLGATLHYVLTGTHRHEGSTLAAVLYAALASEPRTYGPEVPKALAELANRATALDPSERPPSVRAFRDELLAYRRRRGVEALCAAAEQRLEALKARLKAAGDGAPEDRNAAYRLGTEARFGLVQCLRDDPSFERAARSLRECMATLVDFELRQGHVDAAAALLDELPTPDEALSRRVADAREAAARAQAEQAALHAMARDLDPNRGARTRATALAVLTILTTSIVALAFTRTRAEEVTTRLIFDVGAALVVLSAVTAFVIRRTLMASALNRRVGALYLLTVGTILVNRAVGLLTNAEPAAVLERDALTFTVVVGAAAVAVLPRLGAAFVVHLATLALMGVWPEHLVTVFSCGTTVGLLASTWALWRRPPEP